MANYGNLKNAIQNNYEWDNGENKIEGPDVEQCLLALIDSLGANYQYAGVAKLTPTPTDPGTPDQNVFYIAYQPGTYANFDGKVIADGEIAIFKYNGAWIKDEFDAITNPAFKGFKQDVIYELGLLDLTLFGKLPLAVTGQIVTGGQWNLSSATEHYAIPIKPGSSIRLVIGANYTRYTFLKSYPLELVAGDAVDYATGYGSGDNFPFVVTGTNTEISVTAPSDAKYLYVQKRWSAADRTPKNIYIDGTDYVNAKSQREEITDLHAEDSILGWRIDNIWLKGYPNWYDDNVADVIDAVRENNALAVSHFIFVTDPHFPINNGFSSRLAKAVSDATENKLFISGGDLVSKNLPKSRAEVLMSEYITDLQAKFGVNYRFVYGNHENNPQDDNRMPQWNLSAEEIWAITCYGFSAEVQGDENVFYYYWDDPTNKIRFIVLDYMTSLATDSTQLNWFIARCAELSAGWRVAVFIHGMIQQVEGVWVVESSKTPLADVMDGINTRSGAYSAFNAKVMFVMSGHRHNDGSVIYGTSQIPMIVCQGDLKDYIYPNYSGQAVTFGDIDLTNGKLYVARLGQRTAGWGSAISKSFNIPV